MSERVRVQTGLGTVEGLRTGPVDRFAGIRYATAARWCAPRPTAPWSGVLDATAFGASAPQVLGGDLVPGLDPPGARAEDCLFLNVWRPSAPTDAARPVLVWIHGGSFVSGSSAQAVYDGTRLAVEGDVVVVSINYRVGALGFLALDGVLATVPNGATGSAAGDDEVVANAGLRDQLAALGWVQDHIAAFGGDPGRVTVFGESAGGGSIMHLLASPARAGLFARAIVQSGSTGRTLDPGAAGTIARGFLAELGIDADSGPIDAGRLAACPVDELLAAQGRTHARPEVWQAAGLMPFHPSVDHASVDHAIVPCVPVDGLRAGAGRGVDLILGTTRDEMHLFLESPSMEHERVVKRVARYAGLDPAAAEAVLERYRTLLAASGHRADPIDVWGAVFTDREMLLPARAALDAHAAHHAATFGYLFAWEAPPRADGRPLGAAHGIDIPFTFGAFVDGWAGFVGADARAERLSADLRGAWCAFAAHGDPSCPAIGAWPRWGTARDAMVFDAAASRAATDPSADRAQVWA